MSILRESKLRQKAWFNELRALSIHLEVKAEIALKIIKEKPTLKNKQKQPQNQPTNQPTKQKKKIKKSKQNKKSTTARVEASFPNKFRVTVS